MGDVKQNRDFLYIFIIYIWALSLDWWHMHCQWEEETAVWMLGWELVDNHGKVRNTQYFQITVNRGACATTNANRFSKSYDSNQKIIIEQLMFFPARGCCLFKAENVLQSDLGLQLEKTKEKLKRKKKNQYQSMFSNHTIEKRLSSMYTSWHHCTVNIFRKSSLAWHIFTGCFYRCLKCKMKFM